MVSRAQDLWELVSGEEVIPADTPQNAELRRKWKIKCGKALFALQTLVSKDYIEHVRELDEDEPISDARLRRCFIRGLCKEFMPFISSIQGWATQPSIVELENLLANQEALVAQMIGDDKQSFPQNVSHELTELKQHEWEHCLSIEAVDQPVILSSVEQREMSPYSHVRPHNGNRVVVTADNPLHHVTEEGYLSARKDASDVSPKDVYHVLGLKKNLVSVS
nr:Retrovirus-related Pol polyprotein from transposon TNT 1-94 [Ipomoea batatas]